MIALRQCGQKYGAEFEENPVLVDEQDRLPLGKVSIVSHDGRRLSHQDMRLVDRSQLGVREDGSVASTTDKEPARLVSIAP